jgi:hypothetical protein
VICPHWGVGIHEDLKGFLVGEDRDGAHRVQTMKCMDCSDGMAIAAESLPWALASTFYVAERPARKFCSPRAR